MASTIVTKNSSTASAVPLTGDLTQGELAVNVTDKRLFTKNSGGTVVELGINPSSLTMSGGTANGVAYLNGSKVLTTGSALTFDGTYLNLNYVGQKLTDGYGLFWGSGTSTYLSASGASNYIAFTTSSSEQMRLTSTGLGIGTSSPSQKLDVQSPTSIIVSTSTTGTNSVRFVQNNTGGQLILGIDNSAGSSAFGVGAYAAGLWYTGAYPLVFATNNTERMRLDSSGNLGLGVTPSSWGSNYRVLDGFGTNSGGGSVAFNTSYTMILATNLYNDNTNWRWKASGINGSTITLDNSGQCIWTRYAGNNTAGLIPSSATQTMTLDASGNLLVGKTSATYSAAGRGVIEVNGSSTAIAALTIGGSAAGYMYHDGTVLSVNNTLNGPLAFATNNTERARIDSSGNLLVGRTSSSNSSAGLSLFNYTGVAGSVSCVKTATGQYTAWANYYSGTYVGGMEYTNTATSFPTSSDVRLKKDIIDAGSASSKIDQIRIVSHGWKHDDEIVEFGVIAQEIVNIAPQAVSVGDDKQEIEKVWGVDYSKLVPMLIKAHQEQQALITQLTERITALEGK